MIVMFADLVAWLERQLADEEQDASEDHEPGCAVHQLPDADSYDHLVHPDLCNCRVRHRLLDISAKQRLLDDYEEASAIDDAYAAGLELAVRDLSLAYADRHGYPRRVAAMMANVFERVYDPVWGAVDGIQIQRGWRPPKSPAPPSDVSSAAVSPRTRRSSR
jgi:hypothetical protein